MNYLDTDIVIIGAGAAGLAAAVTAAEKGARVVVFEKAPQTGGTANIGNGPFAVESRLQFERMYTLTKEQAFKIHMEYTHWRVDARLVSEYYNNSANTIDWLEKMGVEFSELSAHSLGAHYTFHIVKGSREGVLGGHYGSAVHMMRILTAKAKELGVQIFLKTPVKSLIKDSPGILRIIAEDESGNEIITNVKATIIATGGFSDNPYWIKKYTGYMKEKDLYVWKINGLAGDGIRMAWEVGAAESQMTVQLGYYPGLNFVDFRLPPVFRQPNLKVNLQGDRFVNEEEINPGFIANAITAQKNRICFSIIDENTKNHYIEKGYDSFQKSISGSVLKANNFDKELEEAIKTGSKSAFVANSLEDLANKTGINFRGLINTIDEYNVACETGRDEIFHKNARYLRPVKKPKFYAFKACCGAYGTLGGIKINYKTEVLNKDHEVIPGLFSAGNDANSIYADSYIYPLPGNTMGFALNTGRIAGDNAVKYLFGEK